MKTRYIVYIIIAAIVCFLVYNKLWGAKAKESQEMSAGKGKGKNWSYKQNVVSFKGYLLSS